MGSCFSEEVDAQPKKKNAKKQSRKKRGDHHSPTSSRSSGLAQSGTQNPENFECPIGPTDDGTAPAAVANAGPPALPGVPSPCTPPEKTPSDQQNSQLPSRNSSRRSQKNPLTPPTAPPIAPPPQPQSAAGAVTARLGEAVLSTTSSDSGAAAGATSPNNPDAQNFSYTSSGRVPTSMMAMHTDSTPGSSDEVHTSQGNTSTTSRSGRRHGKLVMKVYNWVKYAVAGEDAPPIADPLVEDEVVTSPMLLTQYDHLDNLTMLSRNTRAYSPTFASAAGAGALFFAPPNFVSQLDDDSFVQRGWHDQWSGPD